MHILLVVKSLHLGGAEVFARRLSESLNVNGNQVYLLNLGYSSKGSIPLMESQLSMSGSYINLSSRFFIKFINAFPAVFLKFLNPVANIYRRYWLKKVIRDYAIDVVNSHLMAADTLVATCLPDQTGFVITMHGSYESNLSLHPQRRRNTLNKADAVIYIAEKNLQFLQLFKDAVFKTPLFKIYNGYQKPVTTAALYRHDFNIAVDDVVFVMAARGDKRKGWEEAIAAFIRLRQLFKNIHLFIVGGGDYLSALKIAYAAQAGIVFTGYTDSPQQYFKLADIGLLPSTFPGESLPNAVVEYLAEGLAVIASDIGEIKNMISTEEDGLAGEILGVKNHQIVSDELVVAMQQYIINPSKLAEHKKLALKAYEKFGMNKCVRAYLDVFEGVLRNKKTK